MNEMPWWAILLIPVAVFFCMCMFMYMGIGMTAGLYAANVSLISVLALAAPIYAGLRWALPRQKAEP